MPRFVVVVCAVSSVSRSFARRSDTRFRGPELLAALKIPCDAFGLEFSASLWPMTRTAQFRNDSVTLWLLPTAHEKGHLGN